MGESGAPGFSLPFSRCCHGSPSVRADGSGMRGREGSLRGLFLGTPPTSFWQLV